MILDEIFILLFLKTLLRKYLTDHFTIFIITLLSKFTCQMPPFFGLRRSDEFEEAESSLSSSPTF